MARKKRIYFQTEETVTTKKKGWVEIDLDYTQFYECLGKTIATLNSIMSVKLLCWSFSQINKENMFSFNDEMINDFNRWLEDNGGTSYNNRSVYNALKELIDKKIVIKWSRGSYQLNPIYIWSDSIEKRIKHLQEKGMYDQYELIEEPRVEYKKL
jgi:hypothetical protein